MKTCEYCKSELTGDAAFCPRCGRPVFPESTNTLVERAKSGDQDAIAALYRESYDKVYYTIKSMIREEDAVFDILQDSYLKAFSHLDSLTDGEGFIPWVKTIAANTARDSLKKKRPLLFSELSAGEDSDLPAEEFFEDERAENLPQEVLEGQETVRLIREILEELPEDQRAAIGMYYYEELSVKEIAAAMDASESAVKSRLLYGRRKIEEKVRALEKKGTKLYSLAPIPFLLWLFRSQKGSTTQIPSAPILQNVLSHTAASSAASAAAGASNSAAAAAGSASAVSSGAAAGAAAGGFSALKIAVAAVAAVAVLAGSAFGISALANKKSSPAVSPAPISSQAPVPFGGERPASQAEIPSAVSEPSAPPVASETEDPMEDAFALYREVLEKADTYDFGSDANPNGSYQYAIEYMHVGDSVPSLLLCQKGEDFIDHVRMFYYDPEIQAFFYPSNALRMGVAGAGGFRGGIAMMGDGNGIQVVEISFGTGETRISRAVRSYSNLDVDLVWNGSFDEDDPYRACARQIRWYDLTDPSGFENTEKPEITVIPEASQNPETSARPESSETPESSAGDVISAGIGENSEAIWAENETANGRIVLKGRIDTFSYEKVIELQGEPDPNAAWADHSRTYRLIVLDSPQRIVAKNGDGMGSREGTAQMILIDRAQISKSYDGKTVTFSINPEKTWWPSDTRLPLGAPTTSDIHIMD